MFFVIFVIGVGVIPFSFAQQSIDTNDDDNDGLTNYDEQNVYFTEYLKSDTDGDGLTDGKEVLTHGTDPKNSDTDYDGLTDDKEVLMYPTSPLIFDTDYDGLSDGDEVLTHGTDPLIFDTDGDGLSDGDEVLINKTDPKISDAFFAAPLIGSLVDNDDIFPKIDGYDVLVTFTEPANTSKILEYEIYLLFENIDLDLTTHTPIMKSTPASPLMLHSMRGDDKLTVDSAGNLLKGCPVNYVSYVVSVFDSTTSVAGPTIPTCLIDDGDEINLDVFINEQKFVPELISITTLSDEYLFGDDIQYKGFVDNSILTNDVEVSIMSSDGKTMTSNFQNVQTDGTFSGKISSDIFWEESGLYEIRARVGNSFTTSTFEFEGSESDVSFAFGGITTDTDYVSSDELSKYAVNTGAPKNTGKVIHKYGNGILLPTVLSDKICGDHICSSSPMTMKEKIQSYLLEKFATDQIAKASKSFGFGAKISEGKLDLNNIPTHSSESLPTRGTAQMEAIKEALVSGVDLSTLKTDDLSPIQKAEKLKELSSQLVFEMYKADDASDAGDLKKTIEHLKNMKKIFKQIKSLK